MKKLALITLASMFAATCMVSTASAALSDRDGTVWREANPVEVAARGDKGGRSDGGRNKGARNFSHGKKAGKAVLRKRGPYKPGQNKGGKCLLRWVPAEDGGTRLVRKC